MTSSPLLLWRSLRHTPLPQLWHRGRLELKRRWHVLAWALGKPRRPGSAPAANGHLPVPLFPPRKALVLHRRDTAFLHLLNRDTPLRTPMDWNPGLSQLERVNLHYMEYLEAVDDAAFLALVQDWIRQNPPGRPGDWRDRWNSYALSLRCVVWMQQLACRTLPEAFQIQVRQSLHEQLAFLTANLELDLGGNHLLKNLKALLWAGRFFRGGAAWTARAEPLLARELERQILADGHHFERSPAYHLQVFADLLECYAVLAEGNLKGRLGTRLDGMAQVVVDLRHPDGLPSLFNDGGLHMAYSPDACLQVYAALRGTTPEPRPCIALAEAGYFGLRGSDSLLLVDCGRIGPDGLPAHGHGDLLAFEWSARGQRLVVDTGVFEYAEGDRRARSRSSRAHNTLTLDGLDQCEFWKSFRVGRRARPTLHHLRLEPGRLELEASQDGYAHLPGKPIHRRSFQATLRRLEVRDEVRGGAGQLAEARLLLHPSLRCQLEPGGAVMRFPQGELRLICPHPVRLEPAPWWPDFGVEVATTQLVLEYGPAPVTAAFLLELIDELS